MADQSGHSEEEMKDEFGDLVNLLMKDAASKGCKWNKPKECKDRCVPCRARKFMKWLGEA